MVKYPETVKAKVCHHDRLIVYWDGDIKAAKIRCADCPFVLWDGQALPSVSFADAMSEILRTYEE
jgi:hypothetical protein